MNALALITALGSGILFGTVALAQQTGQPAATETTAPNALAPANMGMQNGFVTRQPANQLSASSLIGANVVGPDNQNIGDVDDMLLDPEGLVTAVTIDVGGFLGIGEKTVAIPVQSLEFVQGAAGTAATPLANTTATTTGAASAPSKTANQTMAPAAGTGMAPMANAPAGGIVNGGIFNWGGTRLDHVQVKYTRDQLQNAPEYEADNG